MSMDAGARIDSCLLDVADLSTEALEGLLGELPDNALGVALRRMVDEAVNPVGVPYAAFDSAMG
jgi:FXSXX-COOH protein